MAMTVCEVMQECRNFFEDGFIDAAFTISAGGKLTPSDGIVAGQFIAVSGSMFHDGVYRFIGGVLNDASNPLTDTDGDVLELPAETFEGRIWTLKPPTAFLKLCGEISEYSEKNKVTGMQSETFGNYSYTKATGAKGAITWQESFADRLRPYRRMYTEVM